MEAVFAVIVGLVAGSGLAVLVAFPLRRRRQRTGRQTPQARRILLEAPAQRRRAAHVAAACSLAATVSLLIGARPTAAVFMFGAVMIAVQSAIGLAVQRRTAG